MREDDQAKRIEYRYILFVYFNFFVTVQDYFLNYLLQVYFIYKFIFQVLFILLVFSDLNTIQFVQIQVY